MQKGVSAAASDTAIDRSRSRISASSPSVLPPFGKQNSLRSVRHPSVACSIVIGSLDRGRVRRRINSTSRIVSDWAQDDFVTNSEREPDVGPEREYRELGKQVEANKRPIRNVEADCGRDIFSAFGLLQRAAMIFDQGAEGGGSQINELFDLVFFATPRFDYLISDLDDSSAIAEKTMVFKDRPELLGKLAN